MNNYEMSYINTACIYYLCPCVYLFKCASIHVHCLGYQLDQFQASQVFLSLFIYLCVAMLLLLELRVVNVLIV